MFFNGMGTIVAWLSLVFGVGRLAAWGAVVSTADVDARVAMGARYLGSASPDLAFREGLLLVVFGIGFGILAQVGRSIAKLYRLAEAQRSDASGTISAKPRE